MAEEESSPARGPSFGSLKETIEIAISEAMKARPTRSVIDAASASTDFSLFLQKVRESEHHRRLLTLHRTDLLGAGANRAAAFLYLSNQDKPKKRERVTTPGPSKALEHVIAVEVLNPDQYKQYLSSALGLSPEVISRVSGAIADVVAFFGLTLIRSNTSLTALVNDPDFTYAKMKTALGDYKESVSIDGVKDKAKAILMGSADADPDLTRKIHEILIPMLSQVAKEGLPDVQKLSKLIPNLLLTLHLESQRVVTEILEKSGLDFRDYQDVMENLHLFNLLRTYNTIHWCENCSLETPLIDSTTGRIAPTKLSRKHCMNCEKAMSYSALYSPHELVKDALLCRDGFITVLLGWCLRRDGVSHTFGEYAGEQETDFVIIRPGAQTIVECKAFKKEKDVLAIKDELKGAFAQMRRQLLALRTKGATVDRAFLLWNREEQIDVDEFIDEFERTNSPIEVRVFNHLQLEDLIREALRP